MGFVLGNFEDYLPLSDAFVYVSLVQQQKKSERQTGGCPGGLLSSSRKSGVGQVSCSVLLSM